METRARTWILVLFFGIVSAFLLRGESAVRAATNKGQAGTRVGRYDVSTVPTGEWPMYGHDVMRTNFNPDETTINASNVNQLVRAWQANLGSQHATLASSSGPSVAGGKVFVGSDSTSGPNLFSVDAITGSVSWSNTLTYTERCLDVGIGSTAAISGTILTIGGSDSAYYGIDTTDGHILWRNPMNAGPTAFPWESPLLAFDRAYLGIASDCDNPSVRGEIRAVNMFNGTQQANQYFVPSGQAGAGIWNSPALSPDGTKLFVTTGEDYGGYNGPYNRAIVSLDPITLQIFDSFQEGDLGHDRDFGTTPVVFHDSRGRTLVGANHKNQIFYAFDANNLSAGPIWQKSTGNLAGMMPAYDPTFGSGGTLFIYGTDQSNTGHLFAVDPATGNDRWPSVAPGTSHGNMAIANGLIFMNTGTDGLKILSESNGSTLRTIIPSNNGDSNSGLAVSNGYIYWVSNNYLNAWHIAGTPTPTPCTSNFSDVQPSDYFYVPVQYLYCHAAISGYADGTFRPYNNTTRGQLSKVVVLAEGWSINTTGGPHFVDVPPGNAFYPYIETALNRGVISGYADNTFRWGNNVTRAQLCKIVVNSQGWPIDTTGGPHFTDVPSTDPFYAFIETAYKHTVISGYADQTFRPGNNATRGQISKIVYQGVTQP